ncbi:unnamed protein product [Protopolystoma xenopodis]|uniref:Uncharacterized protein n=1 Tax=Protopolystoma xenopodis TaxID=117903 RepID=A0A448WE00_9PLAT|nr:unnamed protein product [Protopolystoma xenopodis]
MLIASYFESSSTTGAFSKSPSNFIASPPTFPDAATGGTGLFSGLSLSSPGIPNSSSASSGTTGKPGLFSSSIIGVALSSPLLGQPNAAPTISTSGTTGGGGLFANLATQTSVNSGLFSSLGSSGSIGGLFSSALPTFSTTATPGGFGAPPAFGSPPLFNASGLGNPASSPTTGTGGSIFCSNIGTGALSQPVSGAFGGIGSGTLFSASLPATSSSCTFAGSPPSSGTANNLFASLAANSSGPSFGNLAQLAQSAHFTPTFGKQF